MPLSSGTFTRIYDWITDRNNAVKIRADRMDEEFDGIADALSLAIYRDGQSTISANIPFNNKRITGLADASADTDAVNRQTADARYMRNPVDLTNETAIADDDELGFYDTSASTNKAITWSAFKTEVAAETAFIPADKVTFSATGTIAATDVQAAIAEVNTEIQARTLTAAGLVTGGGDLSANRTFTVTAATQSDQETGTSTSVAVVPGVQKHHPSAAKAWAVVTWSGGTPTLETSFGVSGITDISGGRVRITFSTAFSSVNYVSIATGFGAAGSGVKSAQVEDQLVGSCDFGFFNTSATFADPDRASFLFFGDQ